MRGLFSFIFASIAALTLAMVSCQKEPTVTPSSVDDVWDIEIEGQTTKADITKTLTLVTNPNGSIKATLKKNGETYQDKDVNWSWTGGNVKATEIGDGSSSGVSYCNLTAKSAGNETVYVTASVGSAPGASIPTKSANVVVNEPEVSEGIDYTIDIIRNAACGYTITVYPDDTKSNFLCTAGCSNSNYSTTYTATGKTTAKMTPDKSYYITVTRIFGSTSATVLNYCGSKLFDTSGSSSGSITYGPIDGSKLLFESGGEYKLSLTLSAK